MASQKELKENGFFVFPDRDDSKLFHLYKDIYNGEAGVKKPYVTSIKIENNNYIFNGQKYKTIGELTEHIKEYNKTLMFPAYLYDKLYRESYNCERQLVYYLVNVLGFERDSSDFRCEQVYVLSAGATKIEIAIKEETDKLVIYYSYGGWNMQTVANTVEEAMNSVNAYVMTKLSETFKSYIDIPNKMIIPDAKIPNITGVKSNHISFDVTSMRMSLKKRLEDILKEFE